VDAGPHPNPAKAALGGRLHRLDLDPETAPVVVRIFRDYLGGAGIFAIAQRLTDEGVASPSEADRARNRHRDGLAWSKGAVRAILMNPRYTGFQVWNKQRKAELLMDVDDVALGYETRMRWNPREEWVWSERPAHPAIIARHVFPPVQAVRAGGAPPTTGRTVTRTRHPYVLRGLLFCSDCGRRMQGNWNNGRPHYRCRYPAEYARAKALAHPPTVYVREDHILPALDGWLADAFAPQHLTATLTALEQAQPDPDTRATTLQRQLAEADRKLARHRAALEAGADPVTVAEWTRQVQAERRALDAQLGALGAARGGRGPGDRLTKQQIKALVDGLGGLLTALRAADPADRAEVYQQLGLRLTYDRVSRTVLAETQPTSSMCVEFVSEGGS